MARTSKLLILVFIFCFNLIAEDVAYSAQSAGAVCTSDSQCTSGQCYPGPGGRQGDIKVSYCVAPKLACAWNKSGGFKLGTFNKIGGEYYLCARVEGSRPQFSLLRALVGRKVTGGWQPEKIFFARLSGGVGRHRECRQTEGCRACLLRAPRVCIFGSCSGGQCVQRGNDPVCEARKVVKRNNCELLKSTEIAQAVPLKVAIIESRNSAQRAGVQPIPKQVRDQLQLFFPPEILDRVRYRVGARGALDVQRFSFDTGAAAVTLGNVIVFDDKQSSESDVCLWSHELEHVIQYKNLDIDGFAQRYMQPAKRGNYNPDNIGSLEGSAEARKVFNCQRLGVPY